ncbi:hypothetical protein ABS71_01865 [bacterium SCN 62-11]|nr:MAG: hypothetical protein ABS71_01865 [bacterium SCN 62-11]
MLLARSLLLCVFALLFSSPHAYAQPASPTSSFIEEPVTEWKVSGDLRVRYELDTVRPAQLNRERARLRLRLAIRGPLTPEWEAGFRLRTGDPHTPFSGNLPLYNSLGEREARGLNVDQAYLHYRPEGPGFQMGLGKPPEFFGDGSSYDSLMWASDYSPLGVWLGTVQPNWTLRGGYFTLQDLPHYTGAQLYCLENKLRFPLSDSSELVSETGYYHFQLAPGFQPFRNRGNATIDSDRSGSPDAFLSGYQLLEQQIHYRLKVEELPVALGLFYLQNLAAVEQGRALSAGATIGETRQPGDYSVFARYQWVGQDAVFSPVAQDDFPLATNFRGVLAGASYQLDDRWRVDATVYTAQQLSPAGPVQYRYRIDWNARF